ncbi:unnamed protein product [Chrysoparadoxa australica]
MKAKNVVQAAWGGGSSRTEYVLDLARNPDGSCLAASLSNFRVKAYKRDTLEIICELKGHSAAIRALSYAHHPHVMVSVSEDNTLRGWDCRAAEEAQFVTPLGGEGCSVVVGYEGHLCAAGVGDSVDFFDMRAGMKKLGRYEASHTDDVTSLNFHPIQVKHLVTGSEDGLMCVYDTGVTGNEEALVSIMNAECPVRRMGFFGDNLEGVYCCSGVEGLSLWHLPSAQRLHDFGDVRRTGPVRELDYLIGCQYLEGDGQLMLLAGSYTGDMHMIHVEPGNLSFVRSGRSGHNDQIRCHDWLGTTSLVTGGEDGRLVAWSNERQQEGMPAASLNVRIRAERHTAAKNRNRQQHSHKPYGR